MTAPVQVGEVLAGKYRVERVLGVGGMGVVVAATHLQLDQLVALKFMLPEVVTDASAVSRFLREAKAAVRLRSDHVARVLDVGTLGTGAPYIVMEYLEGADLGSVLDKRGQLSIAEACGYLLQVCEAMAEAHAQAIVHRDLKPQNLFLTHRPDGRACIKVLDFGISKTNLTDNAPGVHATRTSTMMGSPSYMSPEQIRSAKDVDARTDIWALGVILYQLVSGRLPFIADKVVEIALLVFNTEPPPLRTVRPDAPAELEAVVARCLAKDRDWRYPNVADLVADLARLVPRGNETVERVARLLDVVPQASGGFVAASVPSGLETTLGGAAGVASPIRKPRTRAAALTAGVVALCAAVFVVARVTQTSTAATPSTAPTSALPSTPAPVEARTPDAAVAVTPTLDAGALPAPPIKPPDPAPDRPTAAVRPPARPPRPAVIARPPEPPTKRDPFATRH